VVVRDLVNVREQPGTEHPVVFTAERGVNLLVLARSDRWLHVRHEVGEGWIHDSLVWGPP
jgi:SH3-like domain-containing protein